MKKVATKTIAAVKKLPVIGRVAAVAISALSDVLSVGVTYVTRPVLPIVGAAAGLKRIAVHLVPTAYHSRDWINKQAANLLGGLVNGVNDAVTAIATPWRFTSQMLDSFPTEVTPSGQMTFNNHAGDSIMAPQRSPFHIGRPAQHRLQKPATMAGPSSSPPWLKTTHQSSSEKSHPRSQHGS